MAVHFERQLTWLINNHENCDVILNMENVRSIGSNGIAALISIAQKMKHEDRIFSICGAQDLTMKIISILNIRGFIAVYESEEEAIDERLREAAAV